jgi:hypothetical protein
MKRGSALHQLVGIALSSRTAAFVLALGLGTSEPVFAQSNGAGVEVARSLVTVNGADRTAAGHVLVRGIHTSGTAFVEGARNAPRTFRSDKLGNLVELRTSNRSTTSAETAAGVSIATAPSFAGPGFYPDDLSLYAPSGAVITSAQVYNVFINCDGSCFNWPGTFEYHFFSSNLIHVLDQYTGSTQSGRYALMGHAIVQYGIQGAQLDDATDIAAILHATASGLGTGYGVIYNVFVPKGIDVCISTTTGQQCFSPNNPVNWAFCAYHSYVDFPDIGHVLYTVIPYTDQALVSGGVPTYVCDVGQTNPNADTTPTPNGVLSDSIASFLDHEMSEVITDPDLNAYQVQNSLADYLSEIGDVCVNPAFLYAPVQVSGALYYVQPEYSNAYHACVTVP